MLAFLNHSTGPDSKAGQVLSCAIGKAWLRGDLNVQYAIDDKLDRIALMLAVEH